MTDFRADGVCLTGNTFRRSLGCGGFYQTMREDKVLTEKDRVNEAFLQAINRMEDLIPTEENDRDERDYLFFCFLCLTNLSPEEILALVWESVDEYYFEIHSWTHVVYPDNQERALIMRNEGGAEVVHLQPELLKKILPFRKEHGCIFPFSSERIYRPMSKDMVKKMWKRITDTIGLPEITMGTFRTVCTAMTGVPVYSMAEGSEFRGRKRTKLQEGLERLANKYESIKIDPADIPKIIFHDADELHEYMKECKANQNGGEQA